MLKTMVLICSIGTPPADCDAGNAIDVVSSLTVKSAQQCGFMGQAQIAPTAIVPEPGKSYVKIVCSRVREAGDNRGSHP